MKQSAIAKKRWIRKTFGQEVILRPEDADSLSRINVILVQLWNMAVEQCNNWLSMPKSIGSPMKRSITPFSLNFWLTPVRKSNPDIKSVPIILAREMLRRLAGGFSSYFELKKKNDSRARPPQRKDVEKSFITLTWIQGSFSIEGGVLSASIGSGQKVLFTLGEYIQGRLKDLPPEAYVAQVTVSMRDGKFWANFVCNIPKVEAKNPRHALAIDLGSGDIAITASEGSEYSIPTRRPDKRWRRQIASVEDRIKRCTKGSRSYKRRMGARRIMHNKSLHQHTDHQRKVANLIAGLGMTIIVGKMRTRLGLAKSSGTPDQHWGVQNTGYAFRLLLFIKEKALEQGLPVIELPDPRRSGKLEDRRSKFQASRRLLQ